MNIIYRITYLPHVENNTPPFYYIGSKFNYKGKYLGSPSSKQKDWFTGPKTIYEWWKFETKQFADRFRFEILYEYENITPQELVEKEKEIHLRLCVRSSELYFNKSIATSGWVSVPRTDNTRRVISEKTKAYWDSIEGAEKKAALSERNRITKSKEMLLKWSDPSYKERLRESGCWKGRPKGSVDKKKRARIERSVSKDDVIYASAKIAAELYNLDPVSIRRKCRLNIEGWKYID